MKRAKFLWPLTHGHQHALSAVKIIRERLKANTADETLPAEIRAFFESELAIHFTAEEEMLAEAAKVWGLEDADLNRTLTDHALLKQLAAGNNQTFQKFTDLLEKHIRFEEETLFGRFEAFFNAEEINYWGKKLQATASSCPLLPKQLPRK